MQFHTGKHREVVVACNLEVVVGCVTPCPTHIVVGSECGAWYVVVHDVRLERVVHRANERMVVVETEIRTEHKALQRFHIYIGIAEHTPYLLCVVAVHVHLAQRVLAVAHTTHRTSECSAVFFIYRHRRRHLQRILHRCTIYLLRVSNRSVLAYTYNLVHIVCRVESGREVLEVRILQDTIVLLVSCREKTSELVGGTRQREVVVLHETGARNLVKPVGVRQSHCFLCIDIAVVSTVYGICLIAF